MQLIVLVMCIVLAMVAPGEAQQPAPGVEQEAVPEPANPAPGAEPAAAPAPPGEDAVSGNGPDQGAPEPLPAVPEPVEAPRVRLKAVPPETTAGAPASEVPEPVADAAEFGAKAKVGRPVSVGETAPAGTGSRSDIPLRDLPSSVSTLSETQIRERGVADLNSALFYVPNVNPAWEYGGFQRITIRGFPAVTLIDGRRDDRSTFVTSQPQSGLIGVQRIEILRGPSAVLYGFGALGGVVNLIHHAPSADERYVVDLGIGTPDQRRAGVGASGTIAKGLTYRFDGGTTYRQDFRGAYTDRTQGTAALSYAPVRQHRFALRVGLARDQYNTDTGLPTTDKKDGDVGLPPNTTLSNRYNSEQDILTYSRFDAELGYEWLVSESVKVRERVSIARDVYDYASTELFLYDASGERPVVRRQDADLWGGSGYFAFRRRWTPLQNQLELHVEGKVGPVEHKLLAGYDYATLLRSSSDNNGGVFSQPIDDVDFFYPLDDGLPTATQVTSVDHPRLQNHAIFAREHVTLPWGFKVVVGARYDHFDFYTRRDSVDPDTREVLERGKRDDRKQSALTYQTGLVYGPLDALSAYLNHATGFQPNTSLFPNPDREVPSERGRLFEGGVRLKLGSSAEIDTAVFQINKTNVSLPAAQGTFETAGRVRSRGFEVELKARAGWASVEAGYAMTDAEFLRFRTSADNDLTGKTPKFVPLHSGSLWLRLVPIQQLGVGLGGRMLGDQFADDNNRVPMRGYALADAAVWWHSGVTHVQVSANNLLGTKRYFTSSINDFSPYPQLTPGPQREVLAQVRFDWQ